MSTDTVVSQGRITYINPKTKSEWVLLKEDTIIRTPLRADCQYVMFVLLLRVECCADS